MAKRSDDSGNQPGSGGASGPPSLGARLSQAREARRIPIEGIAQQIRVSVAVLRAIEEDRLEGLAPIYVRGYVRAYARIVGLGEDSVLAALPSAETPVVVTARSGRVMRHECDARRRAQDRHPGRRRGARGTHGGIFSQPRGR